MGVSSLVGDPEVLAKHSNRALLLCWPYEGKAEVGWDARCLEFYTGDCVVYVGDWNGRTRAEQPQGMTSSPAFQRRLEAEFVCTARAPTGEWAMVADELSVWLRRNPTTAAQPVLDVAVYASWRFCHNCRIDLREGSAESYRAPVHATADCEEPHRIQNLDWCSTDCHMQWCESRKNASETLRPAKWSDLTSAVPEAFSFGFK